jgi:hypothetical protein
MWSAICEKLWTLPLYIRHRERDELGAPQGAGKAEQDQRAVAQRQQSHAPRRLILFD